jgi:hypothetical protein
LARGETAAEACAWALPLCNDAIDDVVLAPQLFAEIVRSLAHRGIFAQQLHAGACTGAAICGNDVLSAKTFLEQTGRTTCCCAAEKSLAP